eukprot:TRINITY_DN6035_c0_g1_i1.p1 TRINITY_DN6035_c0_g1~~TRINITY_DN6035_c0_g1_i1.p1  ORF type:complete len:215 (-),score=60.70 TRINITY_DN6035_c0_g1_i1:119-763(-)
MECITTQDEIQSNINIEQLSYQPLIQRINNFLSPEECEHLILCARDRLRPCDEISAGAVRTGYGVFLRDGEESLPLSVQIISKMKKYIPVDENSECMQIMRYREGEQTSPHYDYFNPLTPNGMMKIKTYGQRIATIIMYLNTVDSGGATTFTELGIQAFPRKGDAIVFYNCKPNGEVDPRSIHQGDKVIKGTKWIAIKLANKKENQPPPSSLPS